MAIWTKIVHPSFTCPLAAPPSECFVMVTVHGSPACSHLPSPPPRCLSWPWQCPWNLTRPLAHRRHSLERHRVTISTGRHSHSPRTEPKMQMGRSRGPCCQLASQQGSCPVSPEGLREPGRHLLVIREPQVRGWTGTPFPRGHSTLSTHSREGCCCVIPPHPLH